jgi:hypothetical protein
MVFHAKTLLGMALDITVTVHCNNCNRDGKIKIKFGITNKELEEEYPCIHCGVKGKLKRIV